MLWFTSDWHLYHKNIIKYCNRPFESLEEMAKIIITNYNSVVQPKDVVYFLGDIAFCNQETLCSIIKKLNGKKHIIIGNHDHIGEQVRPYFNSIERLETIKGLYNSYILCHYPLVSWDRCNYGTIMIHGHQHNKQEYNERMKQEHILRYDCGVDANNYYPVNEKQIIDFFGQEVLNSPRFDHHS